MLIIINGINFLFLFERIAFEIQASNICIELNYDSNGRS